MEDCDRVRNRFVVRRRSFVESVSVSCKDEVDFVAYFGEFSL